MPGCGSGCRLQQNLGSGGGVAWPRRRVRIQLDYAKLHTPDKALQIIQKLPLREPADILPLMEILYDMRADANKNDIRKAIQENRHLNNYLKHYSTSFLEHPSFSDREDGEFRSWVRDLFGEKKLSQ